MTAPEGETTPESHDAGPRVQPPAADQAGRPALVVEFGPAGGQSVTAAAVPPGPGVQPPFPAPPVRKEPGTLALGLIIGGVVLLVCLVGGGVILVSNFATALEKTEKQATAAATGYLDAIVDGRYGDAYRMTCRDFRKRVDEQEYVRTKQQGERPLDYELQPFESTAEGDFVVPAKLALGGGRSQTVGLVITWEPVERSGPGRAQQLRVRVCGEVVSPAPSPS